jgi:hypothetical protein
LDLTSDSYDSGILIKAEILRNLGRFEESRWMLEKLKNPGLQEIKQKYLVEIEKKNKNLFRI